VDRDNDHVGDRVGALDQRPGRGQVEQRGGVRVRGEAEEGDTQAVGVDDRDLAG
jgi:hypothetical protein